jgi:nitrogen regulatory protein P-II 1
MTLWNDNPQYLIKSTYILSWGILYMKKIEAIIPHARLGRAFASMEELQLGGLTYYESKGRGQVPRPELQSGRGTSTYRPEFNVNATVIIVVKDTMVDKVVEKLLNSTSTGLAGEGKIFISDVDDAIDIGSKQRGESIV